MKRVKNCLIKTRCLLCLTLLAVSLFALACQKAADQPEPGVKEYDVTGKVTSVNIESETIKLDHEDIPGLMQAMEMDFKVEDPQVLKGMSNGDQVNGRLQVKSGEYIITRLEKR